VSVFKSEKFIPIGVTDLTPVANELAAHFRQRNYQVECSQLSDGQWQVGITRGGTFKAIMGLKSALKIQLEAQPKGTMVRAGAGIFGKQAIPTAITLLVAWPVLITQVWGIVREAGLDDEAVRIVEVSLTRAQRLGGSPAANVPSTVVACTACGRKNRVPVAAAGDPRCHDCGARLSQSSGATNDDPAAPTESAPQTQSMPIATAVASSPAATGARSEASASASIDAFCTGCGARQDASARFCPACGRALAS
jgi:hypothetical protein